MKRSTAAFAAFALVAISTFTVVGQNPAKPNPTFLSVLKEGQTVTVKESGGRYEITLMDDARLSHRITEVGSDFVVAQDVAGVTTIRIPTVSIKSVVQVKLPRK